MRQGCHPKQISLTQNPESKQWGEGRLGGAATVALVPVSFQSLEQSAARCWGADFPWTQWTASGGTDLSVHRVQGSAEQSLPSSPEGAEGTFSLAFPILTKGPQDAAKGFWLRPLDIL